MISASDIQATEPAAGTKKEEVDVDKVEELPTSASDIQVTEPAVATKNDEVDVV